MVNHHFIEYARNRWTNNKQTNIIRLILCTVNEFLISTNEEIMLRNNQLQSPEVKLTAELKTFLDANRLQSVTDRNSTGISALQLAINQKKISLVSEIVDRLATAEFKQPDPLIVLPQSAFDAIRSAAYKLEGLEENKIAERIQTINAAQKLYFDFKKLRNNKTQEDLAKEQKQFEAMKKTREKLLAFFGTEIVEFNTCPNEINKNLLNDSTPWHAFVKRFIIRCSEFDDKKKILPIIFSTIVSHILPFQKLMGQAKQYFDRYEQGERVLDDEIIFNLIKDIHYLFLIEFQIVKSELSHGFLSQFIKEIKPGKFKNVGKDLLKKFIIELLEDLEINIIRPLGNLIYSLFSPTKIQFFHGHLCSEKNGKLYLLTIEELTQFKTMYEKDFINKRSQLLLSLSELKLDHTSKKKNFLNFVVNEFNGIIKEENNLFLTELNLYTELDQKDHHYLRKNLMKALSAHSIQTTRDLVIKIYIDYAQKLFAQSQQTLDELDQFVVAEEKTFAQVKAEQQRKQKELEQARRYERQALRSIEEKKQAELHKQFMFAQTEQKEKEIEKAALLHSIKELPTEDLNLLIKILDPKLDLQDKIETSKFIKLVEKISGFVITPTKLGFILLYKNKPLDVAHREHNGHKLNSALLKAVAKIFQDLKIEIPEILAIKKRL